MVSHSRAPIRVDQLRALNVPVRVEVNVNELGLPVEIWEDPDNRRNAISLHAASRAKPTDLPSAPSDAGRGRRVRVEEILQIWRVDDEWWRHPIARRYVEVVLQGGGHVVLFEELLTHQWFLQKP